MWYIVRVEDGWNRQIIDETGVPNRYGKPKLFKRKKDAQAWVDKKSYAYMTHHYEIKKWED